MQSPKGDACHHSRDVFGIRQRKIRRDQRDQADRQYAGPARTVEKNAGAGRIGRQRVSDIHDHERQRPGI